MKWKEYVKSCIIEYPNLFKCDEYWQSELLVAEDAFVKRSNGLMMAQDEQGTNLGYLTNKVPSAPYGEFTHKTAILLGSKDSGYGARMHFIGMEVTDIMSSFDLFYPTHTLLRLDSIKSIEDIVDWEDLKPDWLLGLFKYYSYANSFTKRPPVSENADKVLQRCLEMVLTIKDLTDRTDIDEWFNTITKSLEVAE